MKIAVVGCAHGELEAMYDTIKAIENSQNLKIDLLICCGDFQSTRNQSDLRSMAVPAKYCNIGSFYKYYSREEAVPVLTVFIGGNHEASNYLQELEYGGWVAPNIYYMGYAGVINIGGVRIGGISGIYKGHDYMKGHFEKSPYNDNTKRSVYHIRNCEVFRLKQIKGPLDIMISHDWPRGVHKYGFENKLLQKKPFFRKDINDNNLGSIPCEELLFHLEPTYWFSAHLHTKFAALIPHTKNENNKTYTKFLALDKCLPGRDFLQVIDIPHRNDDFNLSYDLEWLTILSLTNHLISTDEYFQFMPGPTNGGRWMFTPTDAEKQVVLEKFDHNLLIPSNFVQTAPPYFENRRSSNSSNISNSPYHTLPTRRSFDQPYAKLNPQTCTLCDILGIDNLMGLLKLDETDKRSYEESCEPDTNTTFIDDTILMDDDDNNVSNNDVKDSSIKESSVLNSECDSSADCVPVVDIDSRIIDSFILEDSSNSNCSKRNRSQLSLPSPRFEDDSNTSIDSPLSSISMLSSSSSPLPDLILNKSLDEQNNDDDVISVNIHKKFRRRNQYIYDNCE